LKPNAPYIGGGYFLGGRVRKGKKKKKEKRKEKNGKAIE